MMGYYESEKAMLLPSVISLRAVCMCVGRSQEETAFVFVHKHSIMIGAAMQNKLSFSKYLSSRVCSFQRLSVPVFHTG
jgi:hypothetical protein